MEEWLSKMKSSDANEDELENDISVVSPFSVYTSRVGYSRLGSLTVSLTTSSLPNVVAMACLSIMYYSLAIY
jgi:hypothetical protein